MQRMDNHNEKISDALRVLEVEQGHRYIISDCYALEARRCVQAIGFGCRSLDLTKRAPYAVLRNF